MIILTALLLGACSPAEPTPLQPTASATRPGTLVPYAGPTRTLTPTPTNPDTPTPLPSATPTPRTHVVAKNEDLWGIAFRYGVTLDDLLTANPTVNPRAMTVGTTLLIPAPQYTPTIDPKNPPQPTPVSLHLDQPVCTGTASDGLWCFTSAGNSQAFDVEGVSAAIHLLDKDSGALVTQEAYPPLNRLPAGGSLPLAAFFAAPAPQNFDASVELLSALPIPTDAGRYLALSEDTPQVKIAADGLSAEVSGTVQLGDGQPAAGVVTVAGVAYDQDGHIIGLRTWEPGQPLSAGSSMDYSFVVYSTGSPIASVQVFSEAIPQMEQASPEATP